MKKKLKIDQLRVQSFITSAPVKVQGGGTELCNVPGPTDYSCYRNISCFEFQCVLMSRQDPCVQDITTL